MVLDRDVAEAATYGDVDFIEDWLQNLDRPEDINEVDKKGRTVLSLCVMGVDNHFNDNGDASAQLEDEVAAVIMILAKGGADVNLGDERGWTPLGVSRCKICVQMWSDTDMEKISQALSQTLAKLNT